MGNQRAVSMHQLMQTKFKTLPFEGEWLNSIGEPELTGSWIIWGHSGNGKSRFALQLAKYIATFGKKVAYDALEEGVSKSFKQACLECNMQEVAHRFILLDKEPIDELITRLEKKKGPDVVIIDSLQYTGMSYKEYKILKDRFRNKLFIFISHAEGSHPEGRVAKSVRYDAFVKIWVEGFVAYPSGRYGGSEPYTIWDEGADNYVRKTMKS